MRERPISALPNLGPKTAEWLAAVGITTEAELRAIGPVAAWRRLKAAQPDVITVNALYALHGAVTGSPTTGGAERAARSRCGSSARS